MFFKLFNVCMYVYVYLHVCMFVKLLNVQILSLLLLFDISFIILLLKSWKYLCHFCHLKMGLSRLK
jgi:hypothetical protein